MNNPVFNKMTFEQWLRDNYKLSELTYPSIVSDSFLIMRENLGISFDELLEGSKNLSDYKYAVERWLISNGKIPGTRPIGYTSHMKYLIKYTDSIKTIDYCNVDKSKFEQWLRTKYTNLKEPTYRTTLSVAFFICRTNLGVTLNEIMNGSKTIEDFRNAVKTWLMKSKTNKTSTPSDYIYHLTYLIEYLRNEKEIYSSDGIHPVDKLIKKINHKNNPQIDIPKPTKEIIEFYLNKWNTLENYMAQETALNKLFLYTYPTNDDISNIMIKISSLNDFYSTNIFNVYAVAKHYLSLKIDNRIKNGDLNLVNELATVPGIKGRLYSFATKYCSHHNSKEYPIYDSYVDKMLIYFRNEYKFCLFDKDDLKDYAKFKNIILNFITYFELFEFSIRDIDKYLWQAGKEYFPNWNLKKIEKLSK